MKYLLLAVAMLAGSAAPARAEMQMRNEPPVLAKAAMPRQPVRSSDIASIGYDAATSTLEVEFRTGAVYQYYGVPKSVYEGLMSAQSHGKYFARYVKAAGYRYQEIE